MKLGKHPKKFDRRTLQFTRYLPYKLPTPPPAVDRASRLRNIGMMANDKYGNCTMAAAGHMVQSWTTYAERGTQTISDSEIIKAYLTISPNDQGAYMLDALNHWRKTGVGTDKIEAFVEVAAGDVTQAKLAIQYFGAVYLGMALPDSRIYGPWTTPAGPANPYNGHAVCLIAYDDKREMFKVATWGEIWDMSYAWYQTYVDEAYAVLNDISLIKSSGLTPSGFNWETLQGDLSRIGEPIVDPVPPPAPTPEPTPPAPTPEPTPVSPPQPVDPVVPEPVAVNIQITGVDYAYWDVYQNEALVSQHSQQFEAAQAAVNLVLKDPNAKVFIEHVASYHVCRK